MNSFMEKDAAVYVAGHCGLAGSAIVRSLAANGYTNILRRTHRELDLLDEAAVDLFFKQTRPNFVFFAAAKVGGILANSMFPAEFIAQNLRMQCNVIEAARKAQVKRLLFLGSSCIYPRMAPQPISEEYLLTGPLEITNRPYAVAKIAGIEMCWAFNRQYHTYFLSGMPTNLFGIGDNYDLQNSHVLPALIRKVHEAKIRGDRSVVIWGSGTPLREFLYVDDMADACIHLLNLPAEQYDPLVRNEEHPPVINIGTGSEISIRGLAELICEVLQYDGELVFDRSKPDGTPRKLMNSGRLFSLGWSPKISLRKGIADAYRDFMNRFERDDQSVLATNSSTTTG